MKYSLLLKYVWPPLPIFEKKQIWIEQLHNQLDLLLFLNPDYIPDNLTNTLFNDNLWQQLSWTEQLDTLNHLCKRPKSKQGWQNEWQVKWCELFLDLHQTSVVGALIEEYQRLSVPNTLKVGLAKKELLLFLFVLNIEHLKQTRISLSLMINFALSASLLKGLLAINQRKNHNQFWLMLSLAHVKQLLDKVFDNPDMAAELATLSEIYINVPDIYEYLSRFARPTFD